MKTVKLYTKQVLAIAFIILSLKCIATGSHGKDTIVVRKDPRLDVLTTKQAQINKRTSMMTSNGMYKGYRIQVISTNNREQAFKIKTDLLLKYPDQKAYAMFQSPYFKVRIGNFLKKEDAEKFRKELNGTKMFPQGVFIVDDAIEYTAKEEDESLNP